MEFSLELHAAGVASSMLLPVLMTHLAARHCWLGLPDFGVFPLHIKAGLRCVLVGVLPEIWHRVERSEFVVYSNTHNEVIRSVHVRPKYERVQAQHWRRQLGIWGFICSYTTHILPIFSSLTYIIVDAVPEKMQTRTPQLRCSHTLHSFLVCHLDLWFIHRTLS